MRKFSIDNAKEVPQKHSEKSIFLSKTFLRHIRDLRKHRSRPDRKSGIYKTCPKTLFSGSGREHSSRGTVIKAPDNILIKKAFALSAVTAGTENTPLGTGPLAVAAKQTCQRISGTQQSRRILFLFLPQMFRNTGRRNSCSREQRSANSRNQHTQCHP